MPIRRTAQEPLYLDYIVKRAIVPNYSTTSASILELAIYDWIDIPNFQRGISWDTDNVHDFLQAESEVLGNVILGKFPRSSSKFPKLDSDVNEYFILVDGLQRFTVGTAILDILYDLVLNPVNPKFPTHAPNFARLTALINPGIQVVKHNDLELQNHPRKAISEQYKRLKRSLNEYIVEKLSSVNASAFADQIKICFLHKQIMIDEYSGFRSLSALMNTFLGINTIRVDLGPIDLVRAYIIDKGIEWSTIDIENIENNITSTFTNGDKEKTS
ncbi:UNVERIFIED_ORG: uncharacterized protein DUF262 [Bacillus cereus]